MLDELLEEMDNAGIYAVQWENDNGTYIIAHDDTYDDEEEYEEMGTIFAFIAAFIAVIAAALAVLAFRGVEKERAEMVQFILGLHSGK